MSFAERVVLWNRWYDQVPEMWRFQLVVWSLLALGAINMLLTLAIGFPFALLVVLGIICITAVRLPYALGWVVPSADLPSDTTFHIEGAGWLVNLNRRYEAMPHARRIWVYPAVLLIAGGINMMLTISYRFPFGLLFLLALLGLVLIRAPYTAGWLGAEDAGQKAVGGSEAYHPVLEHDVTPVMAEPPAVAHAAAVPVVAEQEATQHDSASPVMEDPVSDTHEPTTPPTGEHPEYPV